MACMRLRLSAQKKYIHLAILLITAVFFIAPLKALAQNADTATKAKSIKSKRVLYGLASFYANKFEGKKSFPTHVGMIRRFGNRSK